MFKVGFFHLACFGFTKPRTYQTLVEDHHTRISFHIIEEWQEEGRRHVNCEFWRWRAGQTGSETRKRGETDQRLECNAHKVTCAFKLQRVEARCDLNLRPCRSRSGTACEIYGGLFAEWIFGSYLSKSFPSKWLLYVSIGSRVAGVIDKWRYDLSRGQLCSAEVAHYNKHLGNAPLKNVLEKCAKLDVLKSVDRNSAKNAVREGNGQRFLWVKTSWETCEMLCEKCSAGTTGRAILSAKNNHDFSLLLARPAAALLGRWGCDSGAHSCGIVGTDVGICIRPSLASIVPG